MLKSVPAVSSLPPSSRSQPFTRFFLCTRKMPARCSRVAAVQVNDDTSHLKAPCSFRWGTSYCDARVQIWQHWWWLVGFSWVPFMNNNETLRTMDRQFGIGPTSQQWIGRVDVVLDCGCRCGFHMRLVCAELAGHEEPMERCFDSTLLFRGSIKQRNHQKQRRKEEMAL